MTLAEAAISAKQFVDAIAPFCHRVEIAGDIRREQIDIKRIEIVAVPNNAHLSVLRSVVNQRWGKPKEGPFPSRMTRLVSPCDVRIYWTTLDAFGACLFCATGPKTYLNQVAGEWKHHHGGLLDTDKMCFYIRDAASSLIPVMTRDEMDLFNALDTYYVEPKDRK
jgi:hypothetical protein